MNSKSCIQNNLSNPFDIRRYGLERPLWSRDYRALVSVVSFVFRKKGAFTPQTKPRGSNGLSDGIHRSGYKQKRYDQSKENNTQSNGNPEQCALNASACSEDTARVSTRQPTQACSFALYDDAQDEQDRDYNQRDI
jgi:hypothetical protein